MRRGRATQEAACRPWSEPPGRASGAVATWTNPDPGSPKVAGEETLERGEQGLVGSPVGAEGRAIGARLVGGVEIGVTFAPAERSDLLLVALVAALVLPLGDNAAAAVALLSVTSR